MYNLAPFLTYSPTISAKRCQATMLCHSVRSCHSSLRSLYFSLVARLNLATGVPLGVYFTSGSLPTFPTRITLFTLLAMSRLQSSRVCPKPRMQLKGKFKNCAELIREKWEWLEVAGGQGPIAWVMAFIQRRTRQCRIRSSGGVLCSLIPVLLQSICDSFGRRNSKGRPVPRRIAKQVAVPAGW